MKTLNVIAFHRISETGSAPIECTLSDREKYYCKKSGKDFPPAWELVNELLFNRLQTYFEINVPEICLVTLNYELFAAELKSEFEKIQSKYYPWVIPFHFTEDKFDYPIFGSKVIYPQVEFKASAPKGSFIITDYNNPVDLLKIGFFDLWICNKDRKPSNPNVLVAEIDQNGKFNLVPIDNCQAFNAQKKYDDLLNTAKDMLLPENSLLTCGFSQQVVEDISEEDLDNLTEKMVNLSQNSLHLIKEVFNLIPADWQLEERHKTEITNFLTNKDRIQLISKTFRAYIGK